MSSLTHLSLSNHPFCDKSIVNPFGPLKKKNSLSTCHLDPIQWPEFQTLAVKDVLLLDHVEPCEVLDRGCF